MIKVESVLEFLSNKNEPATFEEIWKATEKNIKDSLEVNLDDGKLKSRVHLSMVIDRRFIMVSENKWFLRNKYSIEEIDKIEKSNLTEEFEINTSK